MKYEEFPIQKFFTKIDSEQQAIELVWNYRYEKNEYSCPSCKRKKYYQHKIQPEIRECKHCGHQNRLRVGTIFQNSKLPMLTWVRAIYLMMMGKRGISALELKRQLELGSYRTALKLLRKVRFALSLRDEAYKLEGMIELDGAKFGKRATDNQEHVLVAIESKEWVNSKGEITPRAGFAKVFFSKERTEDAQKFVSKDIRIGSEIHTDAARAYSKGLSGMKVKSKGMYNDPEKLNDWLPWVHKFISNAKGWIIGTHHGVNAEYFKLYLAEYTYRFNRRHDVKKYFSRALFACCISGQYQTS